MGISHLIFREKTTAKIVGSPLKVKEVWLGEKRYIVCLNLKQATKDAADREAILEALRHQLTKNPKGLVGNKGHRKYIKIQRGSVTIDMAKAKLESRFDGKWVLQTNTKLPAATVALKYKEPWQVEQVFRGIKTMFETRPVFHKRTETIRGHVSCSFLALMLRKELYRGLEAHGHSFEWADIKQDLRALQETIIEDDGKRLAVRSQCLGNYGKIF